jgi:hypothetical protein
MGNSAQTKIFENHKNQAIRNEDFHNLAKGNSYFDWAAVGLFYAALHYVDSYFLFKYNRRHNNHKSRNGEISYEKNLKQIFSNYMLLYDMSRNVRYELFKPNKNDVEQLFKKDFTQIKGHILSLFPTDSTP